MSRTIFKYGLDIMDHQSIKMPEGSKILCAQVQRDSIQLWAECDPLKKLVSRNISIYGTGHEMCDGYHSYISTVQLGDGAIVFHVYDRGEM